MAAPPEPFCSTARRWAAVVARGHPSPERRNVAPCGATVAAGVTDRLWEVADLVARMNGG
jgi:hypothetical protein